MGCGWCEPGGWRRKTCDFCGDGHPASVSVSFGLPDSDSDYPYVTIELCEACWADGGPEKAESVREQSCNGDADDG